LPFAGICFISNQKDLFEAKGLTMPEQPTYVDIQKFADQLTDKAKGLYGITLRGKPGWGENMAYIDTLLNTFGATWFDEKWKPTINTPEWKKAISFYVNLMKKDGPPGASSNGFNENLTLFAGGKVAMWIDATSFFFWGSIQIVSGKGFVASIKTGIAWEAPLMSFHLIPQLPIRSNLR
jgi:ABC-type glycerol-3-phosphate transport system substrate-binding protein